MKIADFFEIDNQNYWLEQIAKTDWRSGKYLYELLKSSSFSEKHGFVHTCTEKFDFFPFTCGYMEIDIK